MEFTLDFSRTFFQVMLLISPILISLSSLIIGLGQVVGKIERWDRLDSLYWSLITATTVGYGDIRPKQHLSRVIAIAIAIMGVIFTGILVSIAIEATRHSVAIHVNAERLESYRQSEQLDLIDSDLQLYVE
ncbi:MAG: two pore domain potassium channel family protein [Pseudomonadales bacterium]|nr:two pore domain potassium channel family protein [Pseudomonadales bacterium]